MGNKISSNQHSIFFKSLIVFVWLGFMMFTPVVFADLDCEKPADPKQELICKIAAHLPDPGAYTRELNELESMETIKWCTHCHKDKNGNP